jgi:hypothetical protein
VCGSAQPFSANRAAIDVVHSYVRSRRDDEFADSADLARIPPLDAAPDDPGPAACRAPVAADEQADRTTRLAGQRLPGRGLSRTSGIVRPDWAAWRR